MSNDEVRAGDRFEALCDFLGGTRKGRVVVVTGPSIHPTAWMCQDLTTGIPMAGCMALLRTAEWRRLPREVPTIEERRTALKVGDRITDPALLAVGMRIYTGVRPSGFDRVIATASTLGITFVDGGWFHSESIQRGLQDWERVTFRGWAQEESAGQCGWVSIDHRRCLGPHAHDGAHSIYADHWERIQAAEAKRVEPPAGKPDPTPTGLTAQPQPQLEAPNVYPFLASVPGQQVLVCDATRCEVHHDPGDPACVRAKHRRPAPSLPFKRHPDCYMPSIHAVEVMCMGCEAAIAREATDADRNAAHERALQNPSRPGACPPGPGGLGGTVGPILARLR